jgi:hypothetical protein
MDLIPSISQRWAKPIKSTCLNMNESGPSTVNPNPFSNIYFYLFQLKKKCAAPANLSGTMIPSSFFCIPVHRSSNYKVPIQIISIFFL